MFSVMVKSGTAVDDVLAELFPLLSPGDLVLDRGISRYEDTERRLNLAEDRGLLYLGVGISGGESGALLGPAIMVGGHPAGYARVKGVLTMQALAEAYDLMKRGLGMSSPAMADVFGEWNRGELGSYLVEITERILPHADPATGEPLVELIPDTPHQKGTGKWSTQSALDVGAPAPTIAAAVFARIVSALKAEREAAATCLPGPVPRLERDPDKFIADLYWAVYLTVVAAYAQGLRQLRDASHERGYNLSLAEVTRVWMAGCIIRAELLGPIRRALTAQPDLPILFLAEPFRSRWRDHHTSLRRIVAEAHQHGIPTPAMSSALEFVDAYRTGRLPANLTQAQRDYFGAHTYERVDKPGTFHTEWEAIP